MNPSRCSKNWNRYCSIYLENIRVQQRFGGKNSGELKIVDRKSIFAGQNREIGKGS